MTAADVIDAPTHLVNLLGFQIRGDLEGGDQAFYQLKPIVF